MPAGARAAAERCDLCGASLGSAFGGRVRHIRRSHPAYGRGLLLRVAAPPMFVGGVLGLATLHAPQWVYLGWMLGCFALLLAGILVSRGERSKAGARPSPPLGQLLREGGFRFLLILPAVVILLLLLKRR